MKRQDKQKQAYRNEILQMSIFIDEESKVKYRKL